LNGFVGEFLCLLGAFGRAPGFAAWAVLGVILGAVYLTWMYQRVIFGPVTHEETRGLEDLSIREIVVFAPILALVFFMGIYPKPLLSRMEPSIRAIVAHVEKGAKASGARLRRAGRSPARVCVPAPARNVDLPAVDWVPLLPLLAVRPRRSSFSSWIAYRGPDRDALAWLSVLGLALTPIVAAVLWGTTAKIGSSFISTNTLFFDLLFCFASILAVLTAVGAATTSVRG
jgi:hypothetical protein